MGKAKVIKTAVRMADSSKSRFPVKKTIKLFIGGEFPRTESGRSWQAFQYKTKNVYANLCLASRKDLRNAVSAAQESQAGWAQRSAYNRSQILYRMAEMTEGKREEFVQIMIATLGLKSALANLWVDEAIQAFVYYAGFADKYQQVLGAVNPVSGPHHNFTTVEPIGVVGLIANSKISLGSLVAQMAAPLSIGNTLVVIMPLQGGGLLAPLAEVLATSDLPKGVVNLLTGDLKELLTPMASHMEIQAMSCQTHEPEVLHEVRNLAAATIKRVIPPLGEYLSLDSLMNFVEYKTVWHPVGI